MYGQESAIAKQFSESYKKREFINGIDLEVFQIWFLYLFKWQEATYANIAKERENNSALLVGLTYLNTYRYDRNTVTLIFKWG